MAYLYNTPVKIENTGRLMYFTAGVAPVQGDFDASIEHIPTKLEKQEILLHQMGFSIFGRYLGSNAFEHARRHEAFNYNLTVMHKNKVVKNLDYSMGCAHLVLNGKNYTFPFDIRREKDELWRMLRAKLLPATPTLTGVFACMTMDALAGSETFKNFCDNFGYSDDSIKAFNTYLECQKTNDVLSPWLSTLQEMFQDY